MKNSSSLKHLKKVFVHQQGASDCGVACLLSMIQYYGGSNTLENLRRLSGTNISGTTLLGLLQAASQTGFSADGCEAVTEALTDHGKPVILHVVLEGNMQHYVVCFGIASNNAFIIGDPAKGIVQMTKDELEKIWLTKTCLTLEPGNDFVKSETTITKKREWIKNLLKEDYSLLAIAAAIGVGIALLGLAMAIFSQHLIDEILPKKEFEKLYSGVALVLLLLIGKEGFSFLRQAILLRQGKDFNVRIIKHFYAHLLQLPKPFFDTRKIGELTARINDTARIQKVISQIAGNTIIDILTMLVTINFLFAYSWKVAVGCICILPFYFFLIRSRNKNIINSQRNVMAAYAASESNYISTLQGIEAIKNLQQQNSFEKANKKLYQNYQDKIVLLGKIQISLSFTANIFGILFLISVLTFCSYNVLYNQMTTGELMAVLGMSSSLLPSVTNLALLSIPINEAKIAFDRIFELTNIEPEPFQISEEIIPSFSSLQIKNLSFRFAGRKQLLRNISFEIKRGEIIALIGENGCGKSTITQILQRHCVKESGEIIFNEQQLFEKIPLQQWRNVSGCVSQQAHIFNTTVLENIAFEDAVNKPEKVLNFLNEHGFATFINLLPQSYMTLVGEEGINLSGGQKQIIAFARTLYHNPQLLILDEATASMDMQTEKFILQLIIKLKQKIAVIFITHKFHILQNIADRIYILENGTFEISGNHEYLLQKGSNLYSNYWLN